MSIWPHIAAIIFAMVGYLLYLFFTGGPGNLSEEKSSIDGKLYQVQDLPNKEGAADMLATIQANIEKLREYFEANF